MANHSGNSRKSTGGNVTVGNGAGNSITKMSDDTVANIAGNSVSGDSMFVCWLFCFLMFNVIPFYFEGFCETSCFSCHANVLMFGLDKALLLLFFMPDVNPLFPQQCSRTLFPNH